MLNLREGIISKIPTASKCRGEQSGSWNLRRMNTSRIRFCFGPCWFKTYEPHQSSEWPIDFHFGDFHTFSWLARTLRPYWNHLNYSHWAPADFWSAPGARRKACRGFWLYAHPKQPWFPILQNYRFKGWLLQWLEWLFYDPSEKKHGWLWFK